MIILGLGCNIGNRLQNFRDALHLIRKIDGLHVVQVSPVYESDAMLPENAPDSWNQPFLNTAISCQTTLTPEELFDQLQKIEHQLGRHQHPRWSPRTIDIDILAWYNEIYISERLQIPQYGLLDRPFALWPLADLLPDWIYPMINSQHAGTSVRDLIKSWGSRFEKSAPFHTHQIAHRIDTPKIVGILNITPDSFSDGGQYNTTQTAIAQAKHLFESGADIIDIGAESSRPNATETPSYLEWNRLYPVLEAIYTMWPFKTNRPEISVDTRHADTAQKVLRFEIDWINDVTGLTSPNMRKVVREAPVKLIFMHHLAIPTRTDLIVPSNKDIVQYIKNWAESNLESLTKEGFNRDRLVFDPGIGFGKSAEQSAMILKRINELKDLNIPIMIGHSRKSFLNLFAHLPFKDRDLETAVISNFLVSQQSVDYLRVHNVDTVMRALKIASFFQTQ